MRWHLAWWPPARPSAEPPLLNALPSRAQTRPYSQLYELEWAFPSSLGLEAYPTMTLKASAEGTCLGTAEPFQRMHILRRNGSAGGGSCWLTHAVVPTSWKPCRWATPCNSPGPACTMCGVCRRPPALRCGAALLGRLQGGRWAAAWHQKLLCQTPWLAAELPTL